jgi:hypothetical protein
MDVMIVFPTTHMTLKAERALEREHLSFRTVMKPRNISSECGLALRVDEAEIQRCRETLLADNLAPVRFYRESVRGWECFLKVEEKTG